MTSIFSALTVLTLVPALFGGALGACQSVIKQPLSQYRSPVGYALSNVQSDWPSPKAPFKMLAPQGTCKAADGALYGYFPKGKIGGYGSGFTWYSVLPKPLLSATMSYDVYFDAGFDWKKGGKLPGLCGLDCPVGCSAVSPDRGWSTRLMWRQNGGMTTYAYYPDKPRALRCGEDWRWSSDVRSGRWHNVRIFVKINDPGVANGVSRAWLDGKLVLDKSNVMYRYKPGDEYAVTRAYLTTYAGGSSVSMFAPSRDQYIKFRNFEVWEGDCATSGGTASPPAPSPRPGPSPSPGPSSSPGTSPDACKGLSTSPASNPAGYDVMARFHDGFCAELRAPDCPGDFTAEPSDRAGMIPWGMAFGGRAPGRAGFCLYGRWGTTPTDEQAREAVTWTVACV